MASAGTKAAKGPMRSRRTRSQKKPQKSVIPKPRKKASHAAAKNAAGQVRHGALSLFTSLMIVSSVCA
jgi:hypothetical protein